MNRWVAAWLAVAGLVAADATLDGFVGPFRWWVVAAVGLPVAAAVVALGRRRPAVAAAAGRVARESAPTGAGSAAALGFFVLDVVACLSVGLLALVLQPMSEAPGYSIAQIYDAVRTDLGQDTLTVDIVAPSVAVVVLLLVATGLHVLCLRARLPWRVSGAVHLSYLTVAAVVSFSADFLFGVDVPDVLPPYEGNGPAAELVLVIGSQVGLCLAILLGTAALPPAGRCRGVTASAPEGRSA